MLSSQQRKYTKLQHVTSFWMTPTSKPSFAQHTKKVQKFVSILHVKSHQTKTTKLHNMSPAGKLNTYMHNLAHSIHDPPPLPKFHTIPQHLTFMTHFPSSYTTIASPPNHLQMIPHLPNAWATFYHPSERITSDCPNSFSKYTRGHIAESKISSSFASTNLRCKELNDETSVKS